MIFDSQLALAAAGLPSGCLALAWWRHERRRRLLLAAAMHELRRPLQVLLLSETLDSGEAMRLGPVDLAIAALGKLEAVTGSDFRQPHNPEFEFSWAQLLTDAADRWQQAAWLCGRSVTVTATTPQTGWEAAERGGQADAHPPPRDVLRLAAALDNLILNSLLHGSGEIHLGLSRIGGQVELLVADGHPQAATEQGSREQRAAPRRTHTQARARSLEAGRHGHGLAVVVEAAAALGGSFSLNRQRDGRGSAAVLAIPAYQSSS